MAELTDRTTRALHRIALGRQTKHRVPGLYAGVVRDGGFVWQEGIGAADLGNPDVPPGPDDQFLVASNTKTFTAVLLMQLRDEGRLRLEDTLDELLPGVKHPGLTVRQCLAHVSGMQREPVGDVWDTLQNPDREALLAGFNEAERVHPPHQLWHYSNLVFSMLGEVVARLDGRGWYEALRARTCNRWGCRAPPWAPAAAWCPATTCRRGRTCRCRSRCSTSRPSLRAPAWRAPRPTWPAGRRSSPTRSPTCSPRTPWRRCASPRSSSTGSAGPRRSGWASAWSGPGAACTSATPAACPATSPRCSRTAPAAPAAWPS